MRVILYVIFGTVFLTLFMSNKTSYAQTAEVSTTLVEYYFEHDLRPTEKDIKKVDRLVARLEKIHLKKKSDLSFLKALFYKTHGRLLKRYDRLASMNETIESGDYGCLSGTIIYALLLEHFNYDYEIIELPNHVFLKVNLDDQSIYLESTLPANGFITNQHNILSAHPNDLKSTNWLQVISQQPGEIDQFASFKIIGLTELKALQNFNESVRLYQLKDYRESILHAIQAYDQYATEKNQILMQLVVNKVMINRELEKIEKKQLMDIYQAYIIKHALNMNAGITPSAKF